MVTSSPTSSKLNIAISSDCVFCDWFGNLLRKERRSDYCCQARSKDSCAEESRQCTLLVCRCLIIQSFSIMFRLSLNVLVLVAKKSIMSFRIENRICRHFVLISTSLKRFVATSNNNVNIQWWVVIPVILAVPLSPVRQKVALLSQSNNSCISKSQKWLS